MPNVLASHSDHEERLFNEAHYRRHRKKNYNIWWLNENVVTLHPELE